jgi:glycogen synthase
MRVLHVLHHSEPFLDGYSVRAGAILACQRKVGMEPIALTSVHHELAVGRSGEPQSNPEMVRGIPHHRTPAPAGRLGRSELRLPVFRERALVRALDGSLARTLAEHDVDIVHAHSPVLCGLPALRAARKRGVAFVYEVRAFWEDALLSSGTSALRRAKYQYSRRLETGLFRRADAVVAISHHLVDEIVDRGIPRSRVHYAPNGVDLQKFTPQTINRDLAAQLGVDGRPTIGFVGSFFDFEGLDCLVRALPLVLDKVPTTSLVLVGSGESEPKIRVLVQRLNLSKQIVMVGRLPHEQVLAYYSIMDVLVYPRLRDRLTELVTPLKPLEAMAMGKAVVGSDVGGLKELFDDGRVGDLFRSGDAADLADCLVRVLQDPVRRKASGELGREYVLAKRSWDELGPIYQRTYEEALAVHAGATLR